MSDIPENELNFWKTFQESLKQGTPADSAYLDQILTAAGEKPLRYEEFYYLLSRYPYLDLHHPDGFKPVAGREPKIITVPGGWNIQDFGDRIRTSPGRFLFGAYHIPNEDESDGDSGEAGQLMQPNGSLVRQMIEMADEMIMLAMEKEWPEAIVLGGFYGMIRAAWVAADIQEYKLAGFEPSESDTVVSIWVRKLVEEKQKQMKERHKKRVAAQEAPIARLD